MLKKSLERVAKDSYWIRAEQPLRQSNEVMNAVEDLESMTLQDPRENGLKLTQYEKNREFDFIDGRYNSLDLRTASAQGINLGRQLGAPISEIFNEGIRVVELKRTLADHLDCFTDNRGRMPVYVPEEVKEFMDLRLSDSDVLDPEEPYPATLLYDEGLSRPVFVQGFDKLMGVLDSEEYERIHRDTEGWQNHTEYTEMLDLMEGAIEDDTLFFAIPHIYEKRESGATYYPLTLDMSLVNETDNIFAETYDSSYLDRKGNTSKPV
jgi:hypothetical protein